MKFFNHNNGIYEFLEKTGKGLFVGSVFSQLHSSSSAKKNKDQIENNQNNETESASPMEKIDPSKPIGFCVVGLGELSLKQILPAFAQCKYSRPVALVSSNPDKALATAEQYDIPSKNIYDYGNFDNIRNNPEINVVYIVLPNSMHEEFTIRSANAGKHVLCEKPMATSVSGAQHMIDACKKAARKLMIAYRIQYEPYHKIVKDWTRKIEHGKVKIIEASNTQNLTDINQWRLKKELSGGGPLPDIGIYIINTARYLLGAEPIWVSGMTFSTTDDIRFNEVEETVMFQMGFPGDVIVNGTTSFGIHESRRYRCLTDGGAWYEMNPAFPYHSLELELSKSDDGIQYRQRLVIEEKNQFALEMDHMAQCVIKNQTPYTPGEEGLQDQKIMEAIYKSAKENKIIELERFPKPDAFRGTKPVD